MVTDHHNRACDHRKASLIGHCDCQYLDVTSTLTNLNYNLNFLKQSLQYFEITNQIYDKNIAQLIRNMEMNSNNLTSKKSVM